MKNSFWIDTGTTANPEQREAEFCKRITPFLDLLFNRTHIKIPEIPGEFRPTLEELAADIRLGQIEKHFHIDHKARQITPKTDAAQMLFVFIEALKEDAEAGEQ